MAGNAYPLHIPGNVVGRSARGLLAMAAAGGCSSSVADGGGHNMPSFAPEWPVRAFQLVTGLLGHVCIREAVTMDC